MLRLSLAEGLLAYGAACCVSPECLASPVGAESGGDGWVGFAHFVCASSGCIGSAVSGVRLIHVAACWERAVTGSRARWAGSCAGLERLNPYGGGVRVGECARFPEEM